MWSLVALTTRAQGAPESPPDARWIQSPYRNFGAPQTLLPGRAVLFDEADDATLRTALATDLKRLYGDLYVRQGWRFPFADGDPVRVFVARKEAGGVRQLTSRSVEGGRLVAPAVLLDAHGLTDRQIVREVASQIALATLTRYGVKDGTFVTESAAALIASPDADEEREPARLVAAAPELFVEKSPAVLGRLYLEELTRGAGAGVLRAAWERASETGEAVLSVLHASYAERTGESGETALVRFGARLYATVEPEAAPSRVSFLDLESGALDAAAPAGFTLRHRTFVPTDGVSALRVSWPEDGASGAVVVRYRDLALPPDVLFLSAGDVRTVPLGGVARVDWVVAGGFAGGVLRAPAAVEAAPTFPYSGLIAHSAAGPDGPRISWNTTSHEDLAGWAIFREEVLSDGRIARTGPEIIPSSNRAEESFAYAYLDPGANPATFYRYTVWAVTEDGLLSRAFSVTLRTPE
ncbi:MAG TPA: hypothetical protein VGK86_08455 [Thermoanaerobaculia bacterium]